MHATDLRSIAVDRFGSKCELILDRVIAAGANVDGVGIATKDAPDFESWRLDMEEWIEWLGEAS